MNTPIEKKSSLEEIKERFDGDVERFSNLEIGQAATIDAPLAMELITQAAVRATKNIRRVLDIGCGAGNNTLKLLQQSSSFDSDLIDLSLPMLKRARKRISAVNSGKIRTFQGDFRKVDLPDKFIVGNDSNPRSLYISVESTNEVSCPIDSIKEVNSKKEVIKYFILISS